MSQNSSSVLVGKLAHDVLFTRFSFPLLNIDLPSKYLRLFLYSFPFAFSFLWNENRHPCLNRYHIIGVVRKIKIYVCIRAIQAHTYCTLIWANKKTCLSSTNLNPSDNNKAIASVLLMAAIYQVLSANYHSKLENVMTSLCEKKEVTPVSFEKHFLDLVKEELWLGQVQWKHKGLIDCIIWGPWIQTDIMDSTT